MEHGWAEQFHFQCFSNGGVEWAFAPFHAQLGPLQVTMARFYGIRVVNTGSFEPCPFYRISPDYRISWVLTQIGVDGPDRPRALVCVPARVAYLAGTVLGTVLEVRMIQLA